MKKPKTFASLNRFGEVYKGQEFEIVGHGDGVFVASAGNYAFFVVGGKMLKLFDLEPKLISRPMPRRRGHVVKNEGKRFSFFWRDWIDGPTWPHWFCDYQRRPNITDMKKPTFHKTSGTDFLEPFEPIAIGVKVRGLKWIDKSEGLGYLLEFSGDSCRFYSINQLKEFTLPSAEIVANWQANRHK